MSSSVEDVDWAALRHAYGPADDVPGLLAELATDDEDARQGALSGLWGTVFHQGTRFEASRFVVDPLLDVVSQPGPSRDEIVSLVAHLAVGYPEQWLPAGFDADAICGPDGELAGADSEWRVNALGAYDVACDRVDRLIALLHDPDDDVASEAAHALAFLLRVASVSVAALADVAGSGRSPRVRASAALAVSMLATPASFDVGQLIEDLATDPAWIVRYAAAGLEARPGAAGPLSESARTVLVEALTRRAAGEERLPWNDGDLAGFAAIMLGRRPLDEGTFELIRMALRDATPLRGEILAGVLLRDAFPGGAGDVPEYAHDLSPRQRALVQALEQTAAWQVGSSAVANFALCVSGFGLPGEKDATSRWLSGAHLDSCRPRGRRKQRPT